jgi:two-component system response regulator NreC
MEIVNKLEIVLVDDHAVVRTGISMLLESQANIVIVGEASSGSQALEIVPELNPDVVIMDLTLPDISGIEVTRRLKEVSPNVAIVALTIHEDEHYFFEMLAAGADGYVPKRAAADDLIKAIQAAANGEVYIYPSLAKILVNDFIKSADGQRVSPDSGLISAREQEVLEYLANGLSNESIAEALSISKHTVARHRENLMRKLGLHSRSELVKYAIRKGLIQP